jgi:hypothetical protein
MIPVFAVMASCCLCVTLAADRSDVTSSDRSDRDGRSVRTVDTTADGPVSIHRLLMDRANRMLRAARALEQQDDEGIRGNGLSDGPDPTDDRARSEYDGEEESQSDGDRTEEYQDAVDENATEDTEPRELMMG